MRVPSQGELVRVWELGHEQAPWYRGLLMLAPALPESSLESLSKLTIGARNAHLFLLRRALLGTQIEAMVNCPKCREGLEFEVDLNELCSIEEHDLPRAGETSPPFTVQSEDIRFQCRPLTTLDLSRVGNSANIESTRRALIVKSIESVEGAVLDSPASISAEAVNAIAEALREYDPLIESQIDIYCESCDYTWPAAFDIVTFLWTELATIAQRVLNDVHTLAQRYGWREADVLGMTHVRRQYYLTRPS